jgi:hypothetical protein
MSVKARFWLLTFVLVLVAAAIPLYACAGGATSTTTAMAGSIPGSTTSTVAPSSTTVTSADTSTTAASTTTSSSPPSVATTASALAPDPGLHAPKDGSPEYGAILDTLRVPVEQELRQKVLFVVDGIKVQDGYAFVQGRPVQPDGAPIDYSGTVYQEAVEAGAFDDAVFALLRWTDGSWKVLTYDIGATDVSWLPWASDYRAPEAIFPPHGN